MEIEKLNDFVVQLSKIEREIISTKNSNNLHIWESSPYFKREKNNQILYLTKKYNELVDKINKLKICKL